MKKMFLLLAMCGCCLSVMNAQLGQFPGQVAKTYGSPVEEGKYKGGLFQVFKKDDMTIKVFFKNQQSDQVEIFKTVNQGGIVKFKALSTKEIDNILKQYSDGKTWYEQVRKNENVKNWNRQDNQVWAEYSDVSCILVINRGKGSKTVAGSSTSDKSSTGSDDNDRDWTAFQWSIFPTVMLPDKPKVRGYKLGFPMSSKYSIVNGLDTALAFSQSPNVEGFQTAIVTVNETVNGWQAAVVNVSHTSCEGVMTGVVNIAGDENEDAKVSGAQFGVINYARDLDGIQFGLINYISKGPLPFLPLFNFKFDEKEE